VRENRPFRTPFYFCADALRENKRCAKNKGIKVVSLPYGNKFYRIISRVFAKIAFSIKD